LKKAPKVRPVAVGLFAGKLGYGKLRFPQMAFVMLLFAEPAALYHRFHRRVLKIPGKPPA